MRVVILTVAVALLVAAPAEAGIIFVRADGSGDYATIQAAINAASSGSIIELADGIYQGAGNRNLDPLGKAITIRSASGRPASCVIDCQALGRGFYIHTAETSATVIKGIKILNGEADYGGGIRVDSASPTLVNLVVQDCYATSDGGGVHLYLAGATFNNNVVTGNGAFGHGGGLYVRGGPPTFYNNLVVGNDAFTCGGLFIYGTTVQVRSSSFSENSADDSAGGIAIRGETGGSANLNNCIVGSNPGPGFTIVSAVVTYSCVWGGFTGTGNIDANPQFTTGPGGGYYLAGTSPCLNAGSAAASGLCFTAGDGSVCLSQLTTRTTEVNDSGFVDMGYHYGHFNAVSVPGTWSTIQAAIDNSFSGEQINVASGTRYERIDFHGKALILASVSGRDVTAIDGSSAGTVVSFVTNEGRGSILRGFTISHGSASTGGGIVGDSSAPTIEDCAISLNSVTGSGGGAAFTFARPRLQGCLIYGNSATSGGGVWCAGAGSKPVFEDCVFDVNSAVDGGGVNLAWANCVIDNCAFHRCNVTGMGGGLYSYTSTVTVTGSTFYLSYANGAGAGAGIHVDGGTLGVDHTLIAYNTNGQSVGCTGTPTVTVSCCDFFSNADGNWVGCVAGMDAINNNFTLDPLFCDINTGPTVHANSSCLAANNAACGQVGVGGQGCDVTSLFVKPDGSGSAATIQAAIDASYPGGIVLLSDGTFTGTGNRDLDFKGKKLTVRSNSDDPTRSIIDCQGSSSSLHRGFYFHTAEDSSSVLRSVTIRNAWSTYGAGINCVSSNPKIANCILLNNHATVDGGGMMAQYGSPILEDCRFESNSADDAGGGLMNHTSYPWLRRCQFLQNSGYWGGGGIYNHQAAPILQRCTLIGNQSSAWGGAIHSNLSGANPNLYNCVLAGNTAPQGGAIYNRNSAHPVLTRCTLYGNGGATTTGGGLFNTLSSLTGLDRCILAGSGAAATYCEGGGSVTAVCCDVWGNAGGDFTGCLAGQLGGSSGNFSLDPQFCDVDNQDFTIAVTSPCAPANNVVCGLVGALDPACEPSAVEDSPIEDVLSVAVLAPAAPNPFQYATTLRYKLASPAKVRVAVYSLDGRRVALLVDGERPAGIQSVPWKGVDDMGRPLASGIYIVELRAGSHRATQRLAITR